ncbi:uncharacterized protein LTR77_001320 [Saxophila tyrrhenica]|uniref:Uncharacterized protein n=1 Tax=Saxophila tyrrhenica TaxID=1690608 RepID=A0AAV9PKG5_9PEZI|nr:hypothetical protein LTR77_001320 [Saxophila tyrrhenica]
MDCTEADRLVQQLATGFNTLQDEYQKLYEQHQALEIKLERARDLYNEVSRLYGTGASTTPPLSLASSQAKRPRNFKGVSSVAEVLEQRADDSSQTAGAQVRLASQAAAALHQGLPKPQDTTASGVKIWSGRSADRPEASSSMMPSISESPLEQDFTIEGVPSKLGCPFASMAGKKLSSHAASVLSRYHTNSGGPTTSPSITSAPRVNGKDSLQARKASGGDRRSSFVDPIKAEICGLSDHDEVLEDTEQATKDAMAQQASAEAGVCPIRFLDQHTPEEIAVYFDKHKHELPRSHEVCVKRYQSNEQQIRELDQKYGNLVSMIQGLGAKHKGMLPEDPDENDADDGGGQAGDTAEAEKIQRWASSVSPMQNGNSAEQEAEERQPHFDRPLRDIRVGESPSRPWGLSVPAKYVEAVESDTSSRPAEVAAEPARQPQIDQANRAKETPKCPFGHTSAGERMRKAPDTANAQPAFVTTKADAGEKETRGDNSAEKKPQMVFTGPVFIGYSAEDAAKILTQSGLGGG